MAVTRHDPCRVFLFGNPRICACLAAPRGLSQPATSFIGFQRLDIHRVPFATCRDDARARYEVLKVLAGARARLPTMTRTIGSSGPMPVRATARPHLQADSPRGEGAYRHLQSCTVCQITRAQHVLSVITVEDGPPDAACEQRMIIANDPQSWTAIDGRRSAP